MLKPYLARLPFSVNTTPRLGSLASPLPHLGRFTLDVICYRELVRSLIYICRSAGVQELDGIALAAIAGQLIGDCRPAARAVPRIPGIDL